MRMVKSLLLGSAAGVVAIAGAQAADLPVKAKPVEYVKVCSLYGAGFWYVPGTNTCIKVGSYIRYQQEYQASGGLVYLTGANAQYTREDGPGFTHRIRGVISLDTRTQTDYGTLRGYVRLGQQETVPPSGIGTFMDRAFIQFGGLTAGLADSFFDFFSLARYNYTNNFFSSNMGATGQLVLGYTFQFGNGVSATLSMENGGAAAAGAAATGGRGNVNLDLNQAGGFNGGLGATGLDNGSYQMPDVVANVRIDQAWGSAQVMGALHQNRAAYYNSAVTGVCPAGALGTDACSYPGDKLGWAVGAGIVFNNVFGLQGDSISAQVNYGEGAIGYVLRGTGGFRVYGSGQNLGIGTAADSVFGCSATLGGVGGVGGAPGCTGLEQSSAWGVTVGAEHRWNPQWRTSVYGGYVDVSYGGGATTAICSNAGFGTDLTLAPTPGAQFNCSPDFSMWAVGTRTQWNPHPYLDIGIDVLYTELQSAFAGSTVTVPAQSSRQGGTYTVEDQQILTVMGRIQYNFLP